MGTDLQADAELARRAGAGDQEAFRVLFDRYHPWAYDLAARLCRDSDVAADLVQTAFVKVWEELRRGTAPVSFRAWIATVVRNLAVDEHRRRRRTIPLATDGADGREESSSYLQIDPDRFTDPEAVAQDRELVALVWQAASALSPKDYTLLDLYLRQGLSPDEIADSLGARRGSVYMMLARLKEDLNEAVTSTLLARRGRRECAALDALLAAEGAERLTPRARRLIRRHVEQCSLCQEQKRRVAAPAEIFAGFVLVPVSPELRASLWEGIASRIGSAPPPGGTGAASSRPLSPAVGRRAASLLQHPGALLGLAAVPLVIAAWLVLGGITASPRDPSDVHSLSHVVGQPSSDPRIRIAWSAQPVQAYAIRWSQNARDRPAATADLPGSATETTSPPLPPGTWYFHLRTQGRNGDWTSTVHLGPFLIRPTAATLIPEPTTPPPSPGLDQGTPHTPTVTPPVTAPSALTPSPTPVRPGSEGAPPPASRTPTATPTSHPASPTATAARLAPTSTRSSVPPTASRPPSPTPMAPPTPSPTPTASSTPPPTPRPSPTPALTPTSSPSSTALPTSSPTPTVTPTSSPSPTHSATPSPTATATRSLTVTATPCPPFQSSLAAAVSATNQVTLAWSSTGGCGAASGTLTARYQQETSPYRTATISTGTGKLTDSPPSRCEGTFTIVYTLTLTDQSGHVTTSAATASVTWIC